MAAEIVDALGGFGAEEEGGDGGAEEDGPQQAFAVSKGMADADAAEIAEDANAEGNDEEAEFERKGDGYEWKGEQVQQGTIVDAVVEAFGDGDDEAITVMELAEGEAEEMGGVLAGGGGESGGGEHFVQEGAAEDEGEGAGEEEGGEIRPAALPEAIEPEEEADEAEAEGDVGGVSDGSGKAEARE